MNESYKATLIFDTVEVISQVCNKMVIVDDKLYLCIKKLQKFDVNFTELGYFKTYFHC